MLVAALAAATAHAQGYPTKPVRLIVPSTPGGSVDTVARTVGQKLSERWGQQVVVDNRTGAGGGIAAMAVAKAPPDGYTLVLGTVVAFAINMSMQKNPGYDPLRDFEPVSLIGTQDLMLLIHPSAPARSVKELVAFAKRKPGQLSYASAGNGTMGHLSGELFKRLAGIDLLHVPYRGVSSLLVDVASGEVSMTFASLLAGSTYASSGRLRALAVTGTKRSSKVPELPTMSEAGVRGYESSTWYGILAPARTPQPVVSTLNAGINAAVQHPDVRERLAQDGINVSGSTPRQFGDHIAAEIRKWAQVIKAAGITLQ